MKGLTPHHIGVATKSIDSELALFLPLGFKHESEFRDERQGVRGVFITHKSAPYRLELLENLPHSTRLDSYLKHHHKLYHIAFETSDIEASVEAILRGDVFNSSLGKEGHSACTAPLAESAKIAHSLTSSKLNRDFFDNPQTSGTILECQDSEVAEFSAATTDKVTPAPKSAQSKQSNTAKQGEAAVSLVNTGIVCGEIQDSKGISESSPKDSKEVSESTASVSKLQAPHSKICDDKLPQRDSASEAHLVVRRNEAELRRGDLSCKAECQKSAEKPTRFIGGGGGSPMNQTLPIQTTRKSRLPAHDSLCQSWNLPILPSSALSCCLIACLLSLLSHIPPCKDSYATH